MITTINGNDTIKTMPANKFRVHRDAAFWVGDYGTIVSAKRALEIANSKGADNRQRGTYDGGVNANEETHLAAVTTIFGPENCVTEDDIGRTILPGETYKIVAGFPVRIK